MRSTLAALAVALSALSASAALAQTPVPCAGLAISKLRAAAVPVTDRSGAILATLRTLERNTILGVRRCQGTKYVVMWGEDGAGEAMVERTLAEVRARGLRANDVVQIGAAATKRLTAAEASALGSAWMPNAGAVAPQPAPACESASTTRRAEGDQVFGVLGLSSACPKPAQPARPRPQ